MPVRLGNLLDVPDRASWRRWLRAHHTSEPEIWLVYHSKASGVPSIPYNDAVDEALCFGWIDSTVKKVDADSRAQRFTPRRPGSPISPMNRERVLRLREAGRMTRAGLDAIGDIDTPFVLPDDIAAALKADLRPGGTTRPFRRATSASAWVSSTARGDGPKSSPSGSPTSSR
jgi:uncharacterized protein YdeI (YjbR/CyaY-like superfamily)